MFAYHVELASLFAIIVNEISSFVWLHLTHTVNDVEAGTMSLFRSIGARITLIAVGVAFAFLGVGLFLQARMVASTTEDLAIGRLQAIGESQAGVVSRRLEQISLIAAGLTDMFEAKMATGNADRSTAIDALRRTMERNPELSGAWAGFEPNAFDGRDAEFVDADILHDETGRFLAYFYNFGSGVEAYHLTGLVASAGAWSSTGSAAGGPARSAGTCGPPAASSTSAP